MKISTKAIFTFTLFIAVFCFSACINDINDIHSKVRVLTSTISNYSDFIVSSPEDDIRESRTIAPPVADLSEFSFWLLYSKVNDSDSTKYCVKVSGTNQDSPPLGTGIQNFTGSAVKDGKFTITLESNEYMLSLYAVNKTGELNYSANIARLETDAVLYASSYVDLRNTPGDAFFRLTSNNLQGNTNLTIPVTLKDWGSTSTKARIEIRDYHSNEALSKDLANKDIVQNIGTNPIFTQVGLTSSYSFTYSRIIPAGTYNFIVSFLDDNDNVTYKWSDDVMAMPNRTINSPVYITESLPKKPAAPEKLLASYIDASQNPILDDYRVCFEWTDSDNLEENFELELLDVSDSKETDSIFLFADVVGEQLKNYWDVYCSNKGVTPIVFDPVQKNMTDNPMYFDGGLWANNTELILTLPMGKCYVARIRAVNNTGNSDWTYLDLRGSSNPSHVPFNSDTINMFKIVYHLNGGRYSTDTTITDPFTQRNKYSEENFVVYGIQDKTPRRTHNVYPTGIPLWDGLHEWDSAGTGQMVNLKVGGHHVGTADANLLGGVWTDFDTDGDLLVGAADSSDPDAAFGIGSLQQIMDTNLLNPAKPDIAAFKYWVDDFTKDVSISDINNQISKYPTTNYVGFENLDLWAKYQPIKGAINSGSLSDDYDDPFAYDLYSQWIELNQSAVAGVHGSYNCADDTPSNPNKTLRKSSGNYVSWQITIPKVTFVNAQEYGNMSATTRTEYKSTEAYALKSDATSNLGLRYTWTDKDVISKTVYDNLPDYDIAGDANDQTDYLEASFITGLPHGIKFNSITAVVYKSGSQAAEWAGTITSYTPGTAVKFPEMDISILPNGKYTIVFSAKYGDFPYQKRVTLNITD